MPVLWSVRSYVTERNVDVIRQAHDERSKKVQAKFLSRMKTIAQMSRTEWPTELIKPLSGPGSGLLEIRFFAERVEQRPICFVSGDRELTLLMWAEEKGGRFVPPTALETAQKRKQDAEQDRSRTHDIWLALE